MALTESLPYQAGLNLYHFQLPDANGKSYFSKTLVGPKGLLVVFTCNHCPYAEAIWPRLILIAQEAKLLGINTVAINSNIHPEYPEDAPPEMLKKIKALGIDFPYLVDESQQSARDFGAQCTPDNFLFNRFEQLVYHGRVDDNWKEEDGVNRHDLLKAIHCLGKGNPIDEQQFPSLGCSIKWRS